MPKDKKKTTSPKPPGPLKASGSKQAIVRMYNVGFGDAFLVLLPNGNKQLRILFDCGSIEAAPGVEMKSIVNRVIGDVTDKDGIARIDIVVATHRHKDHVSGFGSASWDKVEVKEVWMPWTEDPTNAEARRIRDIQSRLAMGLQAGLAARGGGLNDTETRYQDLVANALMLSNDGAMKTLHSGFTGNPRRRFLPGDDNANDKRTFDTDALPGVKVHVMGPSRSADVIRDMDPPKGKSYLRMNDALANDSLAPPAPFPAEFRVDALASSMILLPDDLAEIQRAGSLSDLAVAVALDKAVNGTSLMLMLEVSGTYLLFPGDAQWGTWDAAMKDPEWNEMLKHVSFYKVGHHGSHNATPKDFVEKMIPTGIRAMASTLTRAVWPDIPKTELLTGLVEKKADIARSDQESKVGQAFRVDKGVIETRISL